MSYQDTLEYLYGLQKHGMKFGLDNIARLMEAAGRPHKAFRSVHVAGTNGKGSTAAMIESVLRTGGLRTGLFTSPHLISFTERIRINGREISEEDVIALAEEVRGLAARIDDFSPTFFEVVTAMAFIHFKRMKVDWAVIETGLGGRLDSTNVIMPEVSVITRIGADHCEFLGNTIGQIASEKAGIIKRSVPVVSAAQTSEALDALSLHAVQKDSPLFVYGRDFSSETLAVRPDSVAFAYSGINNIQSITVPLAGEHQITNAAVACRAAEEIALRHPEIFLDIKKGIESISWPGRIEMVSDDPRILIDGAHNPDAASTLSAYLRGLLGAEYDRIILVTGVMGDKDIGGILGPLMPLSSEIIFTAPAYGRAASPATLASYASGLGYGHKEAPSVSEAIDLAKAFYRKGDLIVITGSFYTIGEAREALGKKGVLTRLRE